MPRMRILTAPEQEAFDKPPVSTTKNERKPLNFQERC